MPASYGGKWDRGCSTGVAVGRPAVGVLVLSHILCCAARLDPASERLACRLLPHRSRVRVLQASARAGLRTGFEIGDL